MSKEVTYEELFQELKKEMNFLPEVDAIREGYLFGYEFLLIS